MKNFLSVVPIELKKGAPPYYLILQAPSVDITNLITTNPSNYQKLKDLTFNSATNFFTIGIQAIQDQPSLQKVLLLKMIPRYDDELKSQLSKMFNNKLEELWRMCSVKTKLIIGTHTIECTGAIRESRYRQRNPHKYDGIHLYGRAGKMAYTRSVLQILKSQNMTLKSSVSSCIQFKSNNISSQLPGTRPKYTKAVPVEQKKPVVKVAHSDANDNEVIKVKRMEAFLQQFGE